ncbi:hypothetical protein [uncultured Brevundimonas sp.]|uniref:hypothetical protein n=1 Tax=uncultured Brevundimonas sp. TaxID=213418 RepID=UPI002609FFB1|nr:hypothetical protein [uncultured Brevundimonas sp.]
MALNSSFEAALIGAAPLVCLLLEIVLPDHTIRVTDGAAQIVFNSKTYQPEDSVYGVLDQIEGVGESLGTEAPRLQFTFLPASLPALADLTDPTNQGASAKVWFAGVNPATGLLIGEPELLFNGELDTIEVTAEENRTVITFDVASAWERLFAANEGNRLNFFFVNGLFPDAYGTEYVTSIQRDLPWNYNAARPRVVSDNIGGAPAEWGGVPIGGGQLPTTRPIPDRAPL